MREPGRRNFLNIVVDDLDGELLARESRTRNKSPVKMLPPAETDRLLRSMGDTIRTARRKISLSDPAGSEPGADPPESPPNLPASMEEEGRELYEKLFQNDLRSRLEQLYPVHDEDSLRIELSFSLDTKELRRFASLPWELMFIDRKRRFLLEDRRVQLVRYVRLDSPPPDRPRVERLKVLLVTASPQGAPPLNLSEELDQILEVLKPIPQVDVTVVKEAGEVELWSALRKSPTVFHFMGHGGFFENEASLLLGRARVEWMKGGTLARGLGFPNTSQLVVLNACNTGAIFYDGGVNAFAGVAASLFPRGVWSVVAMQFPIGDRAAIDFSRALYSGLAKGLTVEEATGLGRQAILDGAVDSMEWATPTLYQRVPDLRLLDPGPTRPGGEKPAARSNWMLLWVLVAVFAGALLLWFIVLGLGDGPPPVELQVSRIGDTYSAKGRIAFSESKYWWLATLDEDGETVTPLVPLRRSPFNEAFDKLHPGDVLVLLEVGPTGDEALRTRFFQKSVPLGLLPDLRVAARQTLPVRP